MTIDWLKFAPALALLLTPGEIFYGEKLRHRNIEHDLDTYGKRALFHGQHAIDFARAALGTWLLVDSLQLDAGARGIAKYAVLLTQGAVRLAAVFVQMFVCRERDAVNAPFAFVAGTLLTGVAPTVGALALVFAATVALGSRMLSLFFPVAAVAYAGIGFWFLGRGGLFNASAGFFVAGAPWLVPMLLRRSVVISYRSKRSSDENRTLPAR
ncbi:MAG: hypothetical protein RLZZ15_4123 [Verrucomicrobiota bacterium]|jgi:hypothetical protein